MMRDARIRNVESNLIHFDKKEFDLITCKVSYTNNANDLGLLTTMAPYFFSKVTGNWKAHADKFGMLTRILKTNSENATRLANSYNALKNQVRGNYIILGQGEELTFEGDMRTVLPYKELNDSMDEQIAKIVLGQTSTTDQKSYAGSANVHKLILDSYVRSDREFLESTINDQLVPKLQLLGFLPKNVYFGISESVDINLVEQSTVIMNLAKAGFKPTKEYIEQIFDMDIDDTVVAPIIPLEDINNNITI
jgi:phage gp29-like protein